MAVASALWNLEAKRAEPSPFQATGVTPQPVMSMCIIGIKSLDGWTAAARRLADYRFIKVKVGGHDPIAALAAVAVVARRAELIVDPIQGWPIQGWPIQGWSVDQLKALVPELNALDVILLEHPTLVGHEREPA